MNEQSNTEIEYLKQIKMLSNGKFGKDIVIAGDAQIVLTNLMNIYVLTSNRIRALEQQKATLLGEER